MDMTKWDAIVKEEEEVEARLREQRRRENREAYEKEQKERQEKYMVETSSSSSSADSQRQIHDHDHHHGPHVSHVSHHHDPSNNHQHHDHLAGAQNSPFPRRWCGCGYADMESLLALKRQHEEQQLNPAPVLSIAEKNKKKFEAVEATREDGKNYFQRAEYEQAFAIYERGVLILTTMTDIDEEETKKAVDLEATLTINISLCQLKLQQYVKAMEYARMALQLAPTNNKARARIAQAYAGLGEYGLAMVEIKQALRTIDESDPHRKEFIALENVWLKKEQQMKEKDKKRMEAFRKRLQEEQENDRNPERNPKPNPKNVQQLPPISAETEAQLLRDAMQSFSIANDKRLERENGRTQTVTIEEI